MSKYVKLLGTFIFALVPLGIYGISQASAHPDLDLEMVTIEGDSSYAGSFNAAGYVHSDFPSFDPSFTYQNGSFTAAGNLSFLKSIDFSSNLIVNNLLVNHKSFLRGKPLYGNFEELEDHIIYIGTEEDLYWSGSSDNHLQVSVLTKTTNEEKDYEFSLPIDMSNSGYTDLVHTYIQYPKVYFTISTHIPSNDTNQLEIFSVDLESSDPTLELVREIDQLYNTVAQEYYGDEANSNSRYLGLYSAAYSEIQAPVIDGTAIYDYATDRVTEMTSIEADSSSFLTNGENLYITTTSETGVIISKIDTTESPVKVSEPTKITPSSKGGVLSPTFISNDLIYSYEEVYTAESNKAHVQINNLNTGELVYLGELSTGNDQTDDTSFYFTEFEAAN